MPMTISTNLHALIRGCDSPAIAAAADGMMSLQSALQTSDRAVLAYYGRNHPLGATNLPHELYEVQDRHTPKVP